MSHEYFYPTVLVLLVIAASILTLLPTDKRRVYIVLVVGVVTLVQIAYLTSDFIRFAGGNWNYILISLIVFPSNWLLPATGLIAYNYYRYLSASNVLIVTIFATIVYLWQILLVQIGF